MTTIDVREIEAGPDLTVVAEQIVSSKNPHPSSTDLADALTGFTLVDTMKGSSTLTFKIADFDFDLLNSGFFDPNADGKFDPIDVNYPDGSKYWWRVTQVNPSSTGVFEMAFMERPAVYLMSHRGPVKISRAKRTRAEFLKSLSDRVKAGGGIHFHSRELHQKEPLEKLTKEDRKNKKAGGISSDEKVTVKGRPASKSQIDQMTRALDVADKLSAPELAVLAMLCAGIGESSFSAIPNSQGSNYWGVFQGNKGTFKIDDTEGMAESFLKGGKGFQAGGAIKLATDHPTMSPGNIATKVEASGKDGNSFYGIYLKEAEAAFKAYGGLGSGTSYRYKQYNFTVGTTDDPHENYWAAMNRLSDEVGWALFLDGNDIYYDSETELIKQQPVGVIDQDDPPVLSWDCVWDSRHIATEMTLTLVCDPFDYRAGEVFQLLGFGPAGVGSTAKLPGRWLIEEASRDSNALATTFTLKQPVNPNPEPRAELIQMDKSNSKITGTDIEGKNPKEVIDSIVLGIGSDAGLKSSGGLPLTPKNVAAANARHGSTSGGGRSDHQGPPDVAWAVDMSNGWMTTEEKSVASILAKKFGIPWKGSGISAVTTGGFRYQLIWGVDLGQAAGGDHRNHVHFGVRKV